MARMSRSALLVAIAVLAASPLLAASPEQVQVIEKTASAPQTEADKKLRAIMSPDGGTLRPELVAPQLDKFIRDNPDYPRLSTVYSNLLMFASMAPWDPDRVIAVADEAVAKYPDNKSLHGNAIRAKFGALKAQKKDGEISRLALKLLETERDPTILHVAADADEADSLKLLEKAVAERKKLSTPLGLSSDLDDLTWSYAQALGRAGRKDEAMKLSLEAVEQSTKAVAQAEALPSASPGRSIRILMANRSLGSRYQGMANLLADAGEYDKALDYVALLERTPSEDSPPERRAQCEDLRARIYAKMGKPDLELESYAKSFAASMETKTRDKIRELAQKNGKKPEDIFARARGIRNENAQAIKPFELKTLDGQTIALGSLQASAILVNFFFPT